MSKDPTSRAKKPVMMTKRKVKTWMITNIRTPMRFLLFMGRVFLLEKNLDKSYDQRIAMSIHPSRAKAPFTLMAVRWNILNLPFCGPSDPFARSFSHCPPSRSWRDRWGRTVAQIPFLDSCLIKAERNTLRCSKAFFDNSKARLLCKSKTLRLGRIKQSDLRPLRLAKNCERKNLDSRSELPFPLSGEVLLQSLDQSVLKVFGNGPSNTDTLPP